MHSHEEMTFNFNQITPNIYIGNNQCCHIGLDKLLEKEGIYADLSLEENEIDRPVGVKSFLWLPIVDHTPPDMEQMELGVNFIEQVVKINQKIYVHCKNGHGRAPTMVIAYLMKREGKSYDEAYNIIKTARPVMHLDDNQVDFLKSLTN